MHARLLYRRSMLEMYVDDVLYPVYAMPAASGKFGVSNTSTAHDWVVRAMRDGRGEGGGA